MSALNFNTIFVYYELKFIYQYLTKLNLKIDVRIK